MADSKQFPAPTLSFIISTRNDAHGGNPKWRLETVLNVLAHHIGTLRLVHEVEILVTDWGSRTPVKSVLNLTPMAARITRFVQVPLDIAAQKAGDSPFPEVLANNVAIRRARGRYIGRIDQDTLVDAIFLKWFFEMLRQPRQRQLCASAFLFSRRRSIPLAIVKRTPNLTAMLSLLKCWYRGLPIEGRLQKPWFDAPVGILLMHRNLWEACRGYNEDLLYWGFMDAELGLRIAKRYPLVNLERYLRCCFFHLSHGGFSLRKTGRLKNRRCRPKQFAVNGPAWGLYTETGIRCTAVEGADPDPCEDHRRSNPLARGRPRNIPFLLALSSIGAENAWHVLLGLLRVLTYLLGTEPGKVESLLRPLRPGASNPDDNVRDEFGLRPNHRSGSCSTGTKTPSGPLSMARLILSRFSRWNRGGR